MVGAVSTIGLSHSQSFNTPHVVEIQTVHDQNQINPFRSLPVCINEFHSRSTVIQFIRHWPLCVKVWKSRCTCRSVKLLVATELSSSRCSLHSHVDRASHHASLCRDWCNSLVQIRRQMKQHVKALRFPLVFSAFSFFLSTNKGHFVLCGWQMCENHSESAVHFSDNDNQKCIEGKEHPPFSASWLWFGICQLFCICSAVLGFLSASLYPYRPPSSKLNQFPSLQTVTRGDVSQKERLCND